METLTPCPFCGSPALDIFEGGVGGPFAVVICRTCKAAGPEATDRAEAVTLWETRPTAQESADE